MKIATFENSIIVGVYYLFRNIFCKLYVMPPLKNRSIKRIFLMPPKHVIYLVPSNINIFCIFPY